jgi:hypothetical protein
MKNIWACNEVVDLSHICTINYTERHVLELPFAWWWRFNVPIEKPPVIKSKISDNNRLVGILEVIILAMCACKYGWVSIIKN